MLLIVYLFDNPILTINNAQGEENLEIRMLHNIVSIETYNVYNRITTASYCELSHEQVEKIIKTLQELIQ